MFKKTVILLSLLAASMPGCGYDEDKDTTPPTITYVSPVNGTSCVPTSAVVKATFSEVMSPSFINRTTFIVKKGGARVDGTVSYGGTFATFIPSSSLSTFTGYTATLTTGATGISDSNGNALADSNGNPLTANYVWGFATGSTAATVSFSADIQPIFNTFCTIGCHQSGGTASFLSLMNEVDSKNIVISYAYANLVNKSSTSTTGGISLVKPCDSANSVLYQRISGIGLDPSEQKMPQNSSLLDQDLQNLVKKWIDEGALDN